MHQETYQAAGSGYYLVGADGGVFSFGYAPFYGSAVGSGDGAVVGIGASFIVDSPDSIHPLIAPVVYTSEANILYWIN